MPSRAKPWLAILFSFLPGAGHFYTGRTAKGFAFSVVSLGLLLTVIFSKFYGFILLTALLYVITVISGAVENYAFAKGRESHLSESTVYVVFLLLTTGFSALPLLWQSPCFSRKAKIAWTIAVPVLAVGFFTFLFFYGTEIERLLQDLFS